MIVTRQTGSFSCQRQKREHVAILSGDAYEGNMKKKKKPYCMNFGDTQVCNLKNVPWR